MTESRVLEILAARNIGENISVEKTPPFPRLDTCFVGKVSKNIANILYGSLTTKSTLPVNKRLDILSLLRKWCTNGRNHLKIDDNNYDCLIGSLISSSSRLVSVDDNDLQVKIEAEEKFDTSNLNVTTSVSCYYKKIEIVHAERTKLLELVRKRDHEKCGNDSVFDLNGSLYKKNKELSSSYELEVLNDQHSCEALTNTRTLKDYNKSSAVKSKMNLVREKQISLAYSLLNLNKSCGEMSLLTMLLKNLSFYEDLEMYEIKFVNFLWQKSVDANLSSEMLLFLLENFGWIYERSLLTICKEMLLENSHYTPHVFEEALKVLQLSLESQKVHCDVMKLFYELFACSGYNSKLYNFIKMVT